MTTKTTVATSDIPWSTEPLVLRKSEWQGWKVDKFRKGSKLCHPSWSRPKKDGGSRWKCCLGVDLVQRAGMPPRDLIGIASPDEYPESDIPGYYNMRILSLPRYDQEDFDELVEIMATESRRNYQEYAEAEFLPTIAMEINDSQWLSIPDKIRALKILFGFAGIEVRFVDDLPNKKEDAA